MPSKHLVAGSIPAGRAATPPTVEPVAAPSTATRVARTLLVLYLLVPAGLTLTADNPSTALLEFFRITGRIVDRLSGGRADLSIREAEALANVVLFVPLGVLLRPSLPRLPLSVLVGMAAALSLGIEVVQHELLPQRTPSLIDVLNNTGGAALGLVLADDALRLADRARSARRRRRGG